MTSKSANCRQWILLFVKFSIINKQVNGLHSADKRDGIFRWLQSLPLLPDVVCLQEMHCDSVEECCLWKSRLKGLMITYCKEQAACRCTWWDVLTRLIDHLKRQVDGGEASCLGPYRCALTQLECLDCAEAEGARVKAWIRSIKEGEASVAFFFRKERKQSADRWIPALQDFDDVIRSDLVGIRVVLSNFYSSLFCEECCDPVTQEDLLFLLSSSLSPEWALSCKGLLSVDECFAALKGMARGKAPGLDGLPMEFYLKFWDVLSVDLVEVLNFCFGRGYLAKSQRHGVISLTLKREIVLTPIIAALSLFCVLTIRLCHVIAGCLLKVIHLVVDECQTCGVPHRFIGDSVAFLRDVVGYATSTNAHVAVLSLDQEKTFDRVDWSFLHATMAKTGFGPSFIGWLNLFYAGPQSS